MPQPALAFPETQTPPAPKRRRHRRAAPQLATRAELDQRTNSARIFDRLVRAIEADLGGGEQLSTIEHELVEGFVGASLVAQGLNVKLARGEDISPSEHATCVSTMVRVAQRLGLQRRSKDVTPTLEDIEREDA
jgi:hypothetical protein